MFEKLSAQGSPELTNSAVKFLFCTEKPRHTESDGNVHPLGSRAGVSRAPPTSVASIPCHVLGRVAPGCAVPGGVLPWEAGKHTSIRLLQHLHVTIYCPDCSHHDSILSTMFDLRCWPRKAGPQKKQTLPPRFSCTAHLIVSDPRVPVYRCVH